MKFVCVKKCQVRDDFGQVHLVYPGEVFDLEEKPSHFERLGQARVVNFLEASEAELLNMEWKFSEASKTIKEKYGIELKRQSKAEVVAQILDARYRAVD